MERAGMKLIGSLIERARAGEGLPDRHFNPYIQEAARLEHVLFTPSALENSSNDLFFNKPGPLCVEVGTYMGKNLIEMAQQFPNYNFIGLDITYKRTVKTARKLTALKLTNAQVGICDARQFFSAVPESSVSGVCVFFPDPWPKLKQAKNRLLSETFVKQLESGIKENGFLWFKTDARTYFDSVCELMANRNWKTSEELTPQEFLGKDFITVFEAMFQNKGQPTYSCVFRSTKCLSENPENRGGPDCRIRERGTQRRAPTMSFEGFRLGSIIQSDKKIEQ